ncbi:hypothetical protein ARMSODRAFT_981785 [Armillaria solidipes]|uniref:Coenzyme Q-binding protein COQ10 START domain-containing protein n=1 Tax=Armillaria solidipes TaxID=1076256 RepID=A0A2H3B1W4_9AGAR|nr:hypothetical protein ARMSODRAFT_981785 [Armillaria solidipes]
MLSSHIIALLLCSLTLFAASQTPTIPSNLPEATGEININGSSLMNAPKYAVWSAVPNFSSYPNWNPFVRAVSTVVDDDGVEKSLYESRETFDEPLAIVVQDLLGDDIAESFQAQPDALKGSTSY